MKLGDAISKYRDYRQQLCERQKLLTKKLKDAQTNAEMTGDCMWNEQAATLELSLSENKKLFEENQKVLDGLIEQRVAAFNMEVAKQQADAQGGMYEDLAKIMTTVARMCAGDKVPPSDEKKVMEYDQDMYMAAKQAQAAMASIKERQKEYDTLWEEGDNETKEHNPEDVANNTEAMGDLPEIPSGEGMEMPTESYS